MFKIVFLIIAGCIGMLVSLFIVCAPLYFNWGLFKKFYHDLLRWHQPVSQGPRTFDGISVHSICKHCGKDIMQDGQGNWFTRDEC